MYTLEPKRITTMTVVITLDETQVAALVADPAPLVADLRGLLKQWQAPPPKARQNGRVMRANWASDGHAHPGKPRKKSGAGPAKKQRCPKCHKDFTRLAKHLPSCQGDRDPFGKPLPNSVDIE